MLPIVPPFGLMVKVYLFAVALGVIVISPAGILNVVLAPLGFATKLVLLLVQLLKVYPELAEAFKVIVEP